MKREESRLLRHGEDLAETRRSDSVVCPRLFAYTNRLHCVGWHRIDMITSVMLSMLLGLMSTMSANYNSGKPLTKALVTHLQIPEVNPEIVRGEKRLSVGKG